MKIAFLGDAHWGARSNSEYFLQRQLEFYREQFFPYLQDNDIKHVIQFGDLLENRKTISVKIMYNLQREYLAKFEELGITQDIIIGNHDVLHSNTNRISALVEIADKATFPNTTVHIDATSRDFGGCKIDFIPWMNRENQEDILKFMKASNSDFLAGHLEINGFEMVSGIQCHDGLEPSVFSQYATVFSGHFHKQSKQLVKKALIHYLGTPYEMNWGDYADPKGFHIFDTETGETTFIENPKPIYHKIMYNDSAVNYDSFDENYYADSIVKLIVESKKHDMMFDRLITRLQKVAHEFLITDIDSFDVSGAEIDKMDVEDSLSILIKAVDTVETNLDKNRIKQKINSIHKEAEDLMVAE
jgi:DNA repair exonuclease SbcCD nuclease subunit